MSELNHENEGRPARISITVGRKLNDGEYGSYDFNVGIEQDVPPGAKISEFIDDTYVRVHEKLVSILKKNGLISE